MIHFKLNYDSQLQRVSLTWWSDILSKNYYKGPFQPESGASESDSIDGGFLDYDVDIEEPQKNEDLPTGVSFAEDMSNRLAALQGSCQNDSLVMIWKNESTFVTSVKFPSGQLKLKQDRDNSFNWQQNQSPRLKAFQPYIFDYTTDTERTGLEYRGWNIWNNQWKTGFSINRADRILSFLTYLCVRTRWDWDPAIYNSNPYYGVSFRDSRATWPKFAKRLFQLNGNTAEGVLIRIVDTYWSYFDKINDQYYKTQYDYNFNVVEYWLNHNFLPYVDQNARQKLVGTEYQNIVQPLQESCVIKELTICFCSNDSSNIFSNVNRLNTRSFNTVLDFNRFKTIAASPDMYSITTLGTCGEAADHCAAAHRHVQYFVGDTTWFLYLEPTLHKYVENLEVDQLPKELELRDAFSSKQFATFDLGYVSFTKYIDFDLGSETTRKYGITQYVSLQLLWGKWYYYDSYKYGPLLKVNGDPVNIVVQDKLAFAAAVYFRR